MNKIISYVNWGVGIMSLAGLCLFVITYFFSCNGKQIPIELAKPVFVDKHKDQLANFVFLVKETSLEDCGEDEEGPCSSFVVPIASASGVVLSQSKSNIFILTAQHFCADDPTTTMLGEKSIRAFIGDSSREVFIVTYEPINDICLLQGLRLKGEDFKRVKLAEDMPLIGEKVYNIAAPDGMASPNTKLMFDGYFSGCENSHCVYTVPATFGSSGSAVYNKDGELISILVAAATRFENVSMGPHIKAITFFINTIEETVDIY